jgi:hypothetical protein
MDNRDTKQVKQIDHAPPDLDRKLVNKAREHCDFAVGGRDYFELSLCVPSLGLSEAPQHALTRILIAPRGAGLIERAAECIAALAQGYVIQEGAVEVSLPADDSDADDSDVDDSDADDSDADDSDADDSDADDSDADDSDPDERTIAVTIMTAEYDEQPETLIDLVVSPRQYEALQQGVLALAAVFTEDYADRIRRRLRGDPELARLMNRLRPSKQDNGPTGEVDSDQAASKVRSEPSVEGVGREVKTAAV